MVTTDELTRNTISDLRMQVRELIESDVKGGHHPLRKDEKHRAYYCLTGEKLKGASNGEVSYSVLETLTEEYDVEFVLRPAFDAGGPYRHAELLALVSALQEEASDE